MPVHNSERYLKRAIESALSQTHGSIEILVIDDGSTDGSAEIASCYAAADSRIRFISKENEGYGATCNLGLELARGRWIGILEPDDYIECDMIGEMLAFAGSFNEDVDVVKCPYWRIVDAGTRSERRLKCSYKKLIHPRQQPFSLSEAPELFCHHPSIWSAIYKKSYLDENGIRFPQYPGSAWADNRFMAETLLKTNKIAYLDKAFYNYRSKSSEDEIAFSKKNPLLPFERWEEMMDVIDDTGVRDRGILRAHYRRGFIYLGGVVDYCGIEDERIAKAAKKMFDRMDASIVFGDESIPPDHKRLFARMRGMDDAKISSIPYALYIARKGVERIALNGLLETLRDVRRFFSQIASRKQSLS